MVICAASLRVLPEPLVFFQTIDRAGIRVVIVKVSDFLRNIRERRRMCLLLAH